MVEAPHPDMQPFQLPDGTPCDYAHFFVAQALDRPESALSLSLEAARKVAGELISLAARYDDTLSHTEKRRSIFVKQLESAQQLLEGITLAGLIAQQHPDVNAEEVVPLASALAIVVRSARLHGRIPADEISRIERDAFPARPAAEKQHSPAQAPASRTPRYRTPLPPRIRTLLVAEPRKILEPAEEVELAKIIEVGWYAAGLLALREGGPQSMAALQLQSGLRSREAALEKKRTPRHFRRPTQFTGRSTSEFSIRPAVPVPFDPAYETAKGRSLLAKNMLRRAADITDDEAVALRQLADSADAAYSRFAAQAQGLAKWLARRYVFKVKRSRSLDFDDIVQYANEGLSRAIGEFDYTRGIRFAARATWIMRKSIRRGIYRKSSGGQEIGQPDTPFSYNRKLKEGSPETIESVIEDPQARTDFEEVEDGLYHAELKKVFDRAFAHISERDSDILRARFGLAPYVRAHDLIEMGTFFSLSPGDVEAIIEQTLETLAADDTIKEIWQSTKLQ